MGTAAVAQGVQNDRRAVGAATRWLVAWVAVGLCGAIGMVLVGSRNGSIPAPSSYRWWFSLRGGTSAAATSFFYLSVAVLIVGWVGVGGVARSGHLSPARAWAVLTAWALPFFVGPPLFSRDLYSYVGQGVLAHRGLNPYVVSPAILGPGPLLDSIASVWRHTASPYGPLFVASTRVVASVSGSSLIGDVVAYRALELVGVALIMVFLPRLARQLGNDPGVALWLGALSPLALFGFISSGHNDALMVGLLVAGVTLAVEGRLLIGVALCALAATVKLPAAAAVVFLVVDRFHVSTHRWKLVGSAAAVTVVVLVGITLATGYGWTWIGPTALHVPTELRVLPTPSVAIGQLAFHVLHPLGLRLTESAAVTVTQVVFEIGVVLGCLWLLATLHRHEVVRSLGLALLLIVVGSPTVWPWYLLWGLVLLAATTAQRSTLLAVVAALAMLVVGPGGSPRLLGNAYLLVSLVVVAGVTWLVRGQRWRTVVSGRVV